MNSRYPGQVSCAVRETGQVSCAVRESFQLRVSIWHHYSPALPRQVGHISGKSSNTQSQAGVHRRARYDVAGTNSTTRSDTPSYRCG